MMEDNRKKYMVNKVSIPTDGNILVYRLPIQVTVHEEQNFNLGILSDILEGIAPLYGLIRAPEYVEGMNPAQFPNIPNEICGWILPFNVDSISKGLRPNTDDDLLPSVLLALAKCYNWPLVK